MRVTLDELLRELPGGAGKPPPAALLGRDVWSGDVTHRVSADAPWEEPALAAHDSRFLIFSPE